MRKICLCGGLGWSWNAWGGKNVRKRDTPGNRSSSATLLRSGDGTWCAETATNRPCRAVFKSWIDLELWLIIHKCKNKLVMDFYRLKDGWGVRRRAPKDSQRIHGSCEQQQKQKTHLYVVISNSAFKVLFLSIVQSSENKCGVKYNKPALRVQTVCILKFDNSNKENENIISAAWTSAPHLTIDVFLSH